MLARKVVFRSIRRIHSSTLIMGPKRKAIELESSSLEKAVGGGDSESSPKKKVVKEKTVMANYMPKSYEPEKYEELRQVDGSVIKIVSWNVNGLNACMEKGFRDYVRAENADILVIQVSPAPECHKYTDLCSYMSEY